MPQFIFHTVSRTEIEDSVGGSQMLYAIDYDGPHHLLVTGCPGSGKTTVSLMRGQRLINLGKRIAVITYQDLLTRSLKNIAQDNLSGNIYKFHRWFSLHTNQGVDDKSEVEMIEALKGLKSFDEIIVDEGQDFESKVFRTLQDKSLKLTVGADNAQRVHEKGLLADGIKNELANSNDVQTINLLYNYRNTYEVYNFARYFLPYSERANNDLAIDRIPKGNGQTPTVFLTPDHDSRIAQLKILLNDAGARNIAVLVYHIDDVDLYYDIISGLGIPCSKHHYQHHVDDTFENILITTLKSAKGLEFQTVIMPNMERAMTRHYMTEEHYYIGSTRATESLFLITLGDSLPDYFDTFEQSSYNLVETGKLSRPATVIIDDVDLPF